MQLIEKGTIYVNNATSFPNIKAAIGNATNAPIIPVPIISPTSASSTLLNFL